MAGSPAGPPVASWRFEDLPRPLTRVLVLSALLTLPSFLLAARAALSGDMPGPSPVIPWDVQILLLNLSLFIAFWAVYFLSPTLDWMRCQSLRTLLRDQAARLPFDPETDQRELGTRRTQRTLSLLTAQAVFIAVSIILVDVLLGARSSLATSGSSVPPEVQRLLLDLGLLAAVLSFGALLVSFDAIDTGMNSFTSDRVGPLVSFLSGWASRIKYQGLILVYLALVLLLGAVLPILGALSAALLPLVGYPYWFINPDAPRGHRAEARRYRVNIIAVNVLLGVLILAGP